MALVAQALEILDFHIIPVRKGRNIAGINRKKLLAKQCSIQNTGLKSHTIESPYSAGFCAWHLPLIKYHLAAIFNHSTIYFLIFLSARSSSILTIRNNSNYLSRSEYALKALLYREFFKQLKRFIKLIHLRFLKSGIGFNPIHSSKKNKL